jgi:hypothetical protein
LKFALPFLAIVSPGLRPEHKNNTNFKSGGQECPPHTGVSMKASPV